MAVRTDLTFAVSITAVEPPFASSGGRKNADMVTATPGDRGVVDAADWATELALGLSLASNAGGLLMTFSDVELIFMMLS